MAQEPSGRRDVYATVTDTIVAMIEEGAGRFQMPWYTAGGALDRPVNVASSAAYRGVNVVTLWAIGLGRGYTGAFWGTYRQWAKVGAQVRKGEAGAPIVFYKKIEPEEGDGDRRERLVARLSWVFNADQVDGFAPPEREASEPVVPVQSVESLVRRTGAIVRYGGDMAYYTPKDDHIQLPPPGQFTGTATSSATEAFYGTLLHELVHWSGAKHRLDRDLVDRFGIEAYAVEELVAELGAAFLCCELQVTPSARRDHAAYVDHWLRVMREDKRAIFSAASKASQAAEYLLALDARERLSA